MDGYKSCALFKFMVGLQGTNSMRKRKRKSIYWMHSKSTVRILGNNCFKN